MHLKIVQGHGNRVKPTHAAHSIEHVCAHNEERLYRCTFSGCTKAFKAKRTYRFHRHFWSHKHKTGHKGSEFQGRT
jgi:hypothetical protein